MGLVILSDFPLLNFFRTPGIDSWVVPTNVGFRVGPGSDSFKYFLVETHLDNPQLHSGLVDNSGVRVYYTDVLREHDAGVVQVADPIVQNRDVIPAGTVRYQN